MAHQLTPRSGAHVSATEVVQRLSREFRHVAVDEARGQAEARNRAQWIEGANPAIFLGNREQALAFARRLRGLCPGEAAWIEFGDTPEFVKAIVVLPDEPITFGYAGVEDQNACRELIERCAKALEAELTEI